jgi:RNA polymerase sigma-70 factor, ECF subfamily
MMMQPAAQVLSARQVPFEGVVLASLFPSALALATATKMNKAVSRREDESTLNALMERYAEGEEAVFATLYALLAPRVQRFLLRLTNHSGAAEELAQEAFLRMHRARASFYRGSAALPWVYTVTRNVFLDHERKRKVHRGVVLDEARALSEPQEASFSPDQVLESRKQLTRVRDVLSQMPTSQREAFILVRFEGMSISDAAEIMGTTEASVKARAFRAYEALRHLATDAGADAKGGT